MSLFGAVNRRRSSLLKILMSVLAYRSLTKGKGTLAALIGARMGGAGGLGGLLTGGASGALLSAALQQMSEKSRRAKTMAPTDIERVLGEDRILWLMARTGMSRKDLLHGLSAAARNA